MTDVIIPTEQRDVELSAEEIKLRDRFVEEYLVDYQAVAAAMRVGYNKAFAVNYAEQFMSESYVRKRIAQRQAAAAVDEKGEVFSDKRKIREALHREANYFGPGSSQAARVAALAKLMSMYGMDAPQKKEVSVTHRGGVMKVPGISSVDEWEKEATSSQENLRRESMH